jgi:antirestriction protein ArdC
MEASTSRAGKDVCQIITDRVIQLIENEVIPWHQVWTTGGLPQNLVTRRPYRGINLLLLLAAGYGSNYFLTYPQLKDLGGRVKKGEKAHPVIYWKQPEMPSKDDADADEPVRNPTLQYRLVFNISQCEDIPEDKIPRVAKRNNPLRACENIVRMMPNTPNINNELNDAYYQPFHDIVYVPDMNSYPKREDYYAALFHEMVHSTGHEDRLNRSGILQTTEYGSDRYTMEELVADIGECFLKSFAGLQCETTPYDNASAQGWIQTFRNDPQFIIKAATMAQKAVEYILSVSNGHVEGNAPAMSETAVQ